MSTPEISVQLYAIRDALEVDLDGSLGRLAEIGFRNVEPFDFVRRVDALEASFERYGLRAPTGHASFLSEPPSTPADLKAAKRAQTFEAAAALGVEVVIDPFVARDRWSSRADVERTAASLNARAAEAASYGLKVGYHNHDHELTNVIDGRPALEVFTDLLDPSVLLEVDLYWAAAGGVDPVALLQRLGDRVCAVHVKDGPIRRGISGPDVPKDQCPAGQGDVPLTEALAVGSAISYAVVEFDHYEGDIFVGLTGSYAFLQQQLSAGVG